MVSYIRTTSEFTWIICVFNGVIVCIILFWYEWLLIIIYYFHYCFALNKKSLYFICSLLIIVRHIRTIVRNQKPFSTLILIHDNEQKKVKRKKNIIALSSSSSSLFLFTIVWNYNWGWHFRSDDTDRVSAHELFLSYSMCLFIFVDVNDHFVAVMENTYRKKKKSSYIWIDGWWVGGRGRKIWGSSEI